jgi:V/A-type H+-transporting ATPase subunit E
LSLDAIIARIKRDADSRVAEVESAAKAKIAEIFSEAEKRAEALETRIQEAGEREAEAARARVISMAELGARKALLAAKQELLDETFTAAAGELGDLNKDDWRAVFKRLISEAGLKGSYEVVTSKREAAFLDDAFLKGVKGPKLTLAEETREQGGGFVLRGGRTELNFTFAALTRSLRPLLEKELLAVLGVEE